MKTRTLWPSWTRHLLVVTVAGVWASNLAAATLAKDPDTQGDTGDAPQAGAKGETTQGDVIRKIEAGESPVPEITLELRRDGVVIRKIEAGESPETVAATEVTWLGVSSDEASEALVSQLGLDPGVGLVVTFVTAGSPAANAGLRKYDVLFEFDKQQLVHPAQLRKLVHARKEGDVVQLAFYRAGKKQSASATLGKRKAGFGSDFHWEGDLDRLKQALRDLRVGDAVREGMKELHESLKDLRSRQDVQVEIRKGMEEAQESLHEALRQLTNLPTALGPAADVIAELARSGVHLDKDASVVVRSTGRSTKSLAQADDSGTIVIVSNPRLRLTVHDADGKLLFDGEIETAAQQDEVPRDVWRKVEPLLDKLKAEAE